MELRWSRTAGTQLATIDQSAQTATSGTVDPTLAASASGSTVDLSAQTAVCSGNNTIDPSLVANNSGTTAPGIDQSAGTAYSLGTSASQSNGTVTINNVNSIGGPGSFFGGRGFGRFGRFGGGSFNGFNQSINGSIGISTQNGGYSTGSNVGSSGGVTINNVNNLNGFGGGFGQYGFSRFGAFGGGFQHNGLGFGGQIVCPPAPAPTPEPAPTPTPTPSGPPAIGSTRSFNGFDYTLQKISNSKMTYKNTSLQGGQRTVDVKASGEIKTHSPIALDLNGSGSIETTGSSTAKVRSAGSTLGQTFKFDLNGDGKKENIEWTAGNGDGLLVDDRDGKAASSMTGNRLFGDQNGQFNSGYEKLAQLDANRDGQLAGSELSGLEVWVDNGDAKVQQGELKSLADVGVTQIAVNQHNVTNSNGETLMQSTAQQNGQSVLTEDVWFGQA